MTAFGNTIFGYDVIVIFKGHVNHGLFNIIWVRGCFQLRIRRFVFHICKVRPEWNKALKVEL
jgi:hypothetical protein